MKKNVLIIIFLFGALFFNISSSVLSENLEKTVKSTTKKLDTYNKSLKNIELKPSSSTPAYKHLVENDSKILLMAYKNANVLSYKIIDLIKHDKLLKKEKFFILLTEKSSVTDKLLYDKSIKYLDVSTKRVKKLNKYLELLISKNEESVKQINKKLDVLINKCSDKDQQCSDKTEPVSVTGLTSIVGLVNLASEIVNAFKPDINSSSADIKLDNNVVSFIFYNNFKRNGIVLQKVDDYLLSGNKCSIYSKLVEVISAIEQAEMHIAVLSSSEDAYLMQEAKKAKSIIKLINPSIKKLTENISNLINYEFFKNPKTAVIYVKFIHNTGTIKTKQYKSLIAGLFKSDKLIRNALTGMSYEVKTLNSTKKDIIWSLETAQTKIHNDDKINLHKNKSYLFKYNTIKKLPSGSFDQI